MCYNTVHSLLSISDRWPVRTVDNVHKVDIGANEVVHRKENLTDLYPSFLLYYVEILEFMNVCRDKI